MPDIVYVNPARQPPAVGDPIQQCPAHQCDITVVVKERGGKRRAIGNVTVKVDDIVDRAQTNDKGRARFIGVTQPGQNHTVEVTLDAAKRSEFVLVGQDGQLRKPVCDGIDSQTTVVAQQEDKVFTFWVMKRPTLTIEVNRYDEKPLSGAASVGITRSPGANVVYNGQLAQGEHVLEFKHPDKNWGTPLEPGQYEITVTKPQTKWGGGGNAADERDWNFGLDKTGIVTLDLPPGAEERVTFTLTMRTRVQFIAFNIKPGGGLELRCPVCHSHPNESWSSLYNRGQARVVLGNVYQWRCGNCNAWREYAQDLLYLGNEDASKDVKKRCEILKKAINTAYSHTLINTNANVLKLFMAPEFFFRGREAGYPEDIVSQIMPNMSKETSKAEYKDWLFVYGTAIGYLAHGKEFEKPRRGGEPKMYHNLKIMSVQANPPQLRVSRDSDKTPDICAYILETTRQEYQWKIVQRKRLGANAESFIRGAQRVPNSNLEHNITLAAAPARAFTNGRVAFVQPQAPGERYLLEVKGCRAGAGGNQHIITVTKGRDDTSVCARIDTTGPVPWKLVQGAEEVEISASQLLDGGDYDLTVDTANALVVGPCYLIEPEAVEVFNIALVQKGGEDPNPQQTRLVRKGNLREVLIYKEHVSAIDYRGEAFGARLDFGQVAHHRIEFRGQQHTVLPTEGSRAMLGAVRNVPGRTPGQVSPEVAGARKVSEINRTGLGGGSVFTIDGITFGLEVCLDHDQQKLRDYYSGAGAAASRGEPKVQIQLIPSAGMDIRTGSICCSHSGHDGLVFNVDGVRGDSAVNTWDGTNPTVVANQGATPEVAMGTFSGVTEDKYFKERGTIKVYPVKDIPEAETV